MGKLINKIYVRIIIAVVFGLLLASTFTSIQGPCTTVVPGENTANCVEFSKAVTYPNDLLNNKQDSLVHFLQTFAFKPSAGVNFLDPIRHSTFLVVFGF